MLKRLVVDNAGMLPILESRSFDAKRINQISIQPQQIPSWQSSSGGKNNEGDAPLSRS